jgi:hypothetical protein
MRKALGGAALALATALVALTAPARANLVDNGDFSAGDTGFSSEYYDVTGTGQASSPGDGSASNPYNAYNETTYAVGANSDLYHNLWANVPAPGGLGNYLIVNGNSLDGSPAVTGALPLTVWEQTISVAPDTLYEFSAQAANIYGDNPATLEFYANSSLLGPAFTVGAAGTTGIWNTFGASWYSGSNTSLVLRIVDTNTIASGNDFWVDNIALAAPEPSTWAMMAIGFAGLGFAGWRRGRRPIAAFTDA